MFHDHLDYFQNHLLEVGLTQKLGIRYAGVVRLLGIFIVVCDG